MNEHPEFDRACASRSLTERARPRQLLAEGSLSRRAARLVLLLLMPGAVLCVSGLPSWAQSMRQPFEDGETLTADALNGEFDALKMRIATLEAEGARPLSLSADDARDDDV